jgi:hypothetical protein
VVLKLGKAQPHLQLAMLANRRRFCPRPSSTGKFSASWRCSPRAGAVYP